MKQLNSIDSQYTLIVIFELLRPEELIFFMSKLEKYRVLKDYEREYLFHCISFASQKRVDVKYCNNFEKTCKTVLEYQNNEQGISKSTDFKKTEYIEKMGWQNFVQLNRIENGRATMPYDNINKFCSGFTKLAEKIFWVNQLMYFFPGSYVYEDREYNMEFICLQFTISNLSEASIKFILNNMNTAQKIIFSEIYSYLQRSEKSSLEMQQCSLYEMIGYYLKKNAITVDQLVFDELQISKQTWYKWKKSWGDAEKNGFLNEPIPRMHRNDLLLIAVVTKMSVLNAMLLLFFAGYRMGTDMRDLDVFNYLAYGTGNVETIKERLRNNRKLTSISEAFCYD